MSVLNFRRLLLALLIGSGPFVFATLALCAEGPSTTAKIPPERIANARARANFAAAEVLEAPPPNAAAERDRRELVEEIVEPQLQLNVRVERSKLIRMKLPVNRTSITDPTIVDLVQYSPTEFEVMGLKAGETSLTFWFGEGPDARILRYQVNVARDTTISPQRKLDIEELESMITELFPNSMVQLFPAADKLIVRGQARDAEEVTQIMSVLRSQSGGGSNGQGGQGQGGSFLTQGAAASLTPNSGPGTEGTIINMLRVPGEQQVLLKVRIAELSRSALREFGLDIKINSGGTALSSLFGTGGNLTALLDNGDVNLLLRALSTNSYSKVLAEPNLITLSGQTATFIAGGQFAVPTAVGVGGIGAASTSFQGFGTQLLFTPTVLDKDKIRLRVVPTFSELNTANSVNGIPGLNTRSVNTMVDMREGQWLAIAGLLQDEQKGSKKWVPGTDAVPLVNLLFSNKTTARNETELIILVSPELVHPLEREEVPVMLPGFEVTDPTDKAFYLQSRIEGKPGHLYRSTVWPTQRERLREALREAKRDSRYLPSETYFVRGPHGFTQ